MFKVLCISKCSLLRTVYSLMHLCRTLKNCKQNLFWIVQHYPIRLASKFSVCAKSLSRASYFFWNFAENLPLWILPFLTYTRRWHSVKLFRCNTRQKSSKRHHGWLRLDWFTIAGSVKSFFLHFRIKSCMLCYTYPFYLESLDWHSLSWNVTARKENEPEPNLKKNWCI